MNEHIGEIAALYALGVLDDAERLEVDAHAARCEACAQALGQAADDVTALGEADAHHALPANVRPLRGRRPRFVFPLALQIAAALLIAILPSAYFYDQSRTMRDTVVAQDAAMARMTSMPHRTVAFTSSTGADAHVMYGNDGSWYVIVVRGATKALHVAWMHDGTKTTLGTPQGRGGVATLYLPKSHRMDRLALVDDNDTVVAQANLVY